MLIISLILSLVLLLVVNRAVRRSTNPTATTIACTLVFGFGPILAMCILPVLTLQCLILVVAVPVSRLRRWRPRSFLLLSCGATAATYVVVGWFAFQDFSHLREQFPYISMEERLSPPRTPPDEQPLPRDAEKRLAFLEELIEHRDPRNGLDQWRLKQLEQLHEDMIQLFIKQPGFGFARMPGLSRATLTLGLRDNQPVPQPGPFSTAAWSAEVPAMQPLSKNEPESAKELLRMHQLSVVDFSNPKGFGFIKDRRHVAGFQEHQLSQEPDPVQRWVLRRLDLVGLVLRDMPVAYVSAHLPRMEELRDAPTRPLDPFEQAGLKALRGGQDLFVRDLAEVRRVLGAVRSAKQCVSCHGGRRGDLLGAFSYTLVRGQP